MNVISIVCLQFADGLSQCAIWRHSKRRRGQEFVLCHNRNPVFRSLLWGKEHRLSQTTYGMHHGEIRVTGGKVRPMMTSCNGIFSALLAFCEENTPVTSGFHLQGPVARSFDVSLICAWTNGWKQPRRRWLRSYRAHYHVTIMHRSFLKGNAKYKLSTMNLARHNLG